MRGSVLVVYLSKQSYYNISPAAAANNKPLKQPLVLCERQKPLNNHLYCTRNRSHQKQKTMVSHTISADIESYMQTDHLSIIS